MTAPLSSDRSRAALRISARVSAELLLVFALSAVALWLLGRMWSVVWPLVVGLLLTTLTWPAARFLRRRGWPPALAASVVTVLFLLVRQINRLLRTQAQSANTDTPPPEDILLLREIRDSLKSRGS